VAHRAFAATNWITTISFVIGSLKEWVRDFGMFITLLTTSVLFFSGSVCSDDAWE
jgi:hypothetical protein